MLELPNRFSLKYLFVLVAIAGIASWLVRSFYPLGPLYASLFITACAGGMALLRHRGPLARSCVLVFLIIGIVGVPTVTMTGHPVPISRLNRIQPGATKAEVQSLLGAPTRIGGNDWVYSGSTWCYITIHFTPDGTVDFVDHDH